MQFSEYLFKILLANVILGKRSYSANVSEVSNSVNAHSV